MKLVIGDKNYSSWSMRPWVLLKHFGIPFEEVCIDLHEAGSKAAILAHSSSGKLPYLSAQDGLSVWDSLAIAETLADRFPQHALWPRDPVARGHARSISAEMHSGVGELRSNMWMNIRASFAGKGATPGALADIARVDAIWSGCIEQYGGPFLFGERSAADAMYAPVVTRFVTYDVKLDPEIVDYGQRIMALPEMQQWIADAQQEVEEIDELDVEF